MIDPTPDHRNPLAVWIGRLFHPYLICIPTLLAVLHPLPLVSAAGLMLLVVVILLPPLILVVSLLKRQQRFVYQRQTRTPIYLTFWVSLWVCLAVIIFLQAPLPLIASILSLLVWLPLQLAVNTWATKVSTHAAVMTGCSTALFLLGKLDHPFVFLVVLVAVAGVLWARITTKNHTLEQVLLGVLTGFLPVIVVFQALML